MGRMEKLRLGRLKPPPEVVRRGAVLKKVSEAAVEITADFPNGAPDYIERGVSENATQLGFKNKDWE